MTSGETGGNYELTYTVLTHINLLVSKKNSELFQSDYKQFFCKYDEPSYIKEIKISILGYISNERNIQDIINELR
jgi:AP-4 complex subunit beta-1